MVKLWKYYLIGPELHIAMKLLECKKGCETIRRQIFKEFKKLAYPQNT